MCENRIKQNKKTKKKLNRLRQNDRAKMAEKISYLPMNVTGRGRERGRESDFGESKKEFVELGSEFSFFSVFNSRIFFNFILLYCILYQFS